MNLKNGRMARQLSLILIFGVSLGLIAFFGNRYFHWNPVAVVAIGAVILLDVFAIRTFYLRRQLKANLALLNAGRTDEFVANMEKLLTFSQNPSWYLMIALNLSAGYFRQGRFDDVVRLLDGIPSVRMTGPVQTVYYNNYAAALFRAGRVEEAVRFLAGHEHELEVSADEIPYLGALQGTRAWLLAAKGQTAQAHALIDVLRAKDDPQVQQDLDALEAWLARTEATDA